MRKIPNLAGFTNVERRVFEADEEDSKMRGNPNPSCRFKKGVSGNPGGRPKNSGIGWVMEKRLPAALRRRLRLPETATYADLIKLAEVAREVGIRNPAQNSK